MDRKDELLKELAKAPPFLVDELSRLIEQAREAPNELRAA